MSPNNYDSMATGGPAEWYPYNPAVPNKDALQAFLKNDEKTSGETKKSEPAPIKPVPVPNEVRAMVIAFAHAKKALYWSPRRIRRAVERKFGIDVLKD